MNSIALAIAEALKTRGYTRPSVCIVYEHDERFPRADVSYYDALGEYTLKYISEREVEEKHEGNISSALWSFVHSLPTATEGAQAALAKQMAKMLDKARAAGIEERFSGEIAAMVKRLSENILTDQRASAEDEIPS